MDILGRSDMGRYTLDPRNHHARNLQSYDVEKEGYQEAKGHWGGPMVRPYRAPRQLHPPDGRHKLHETLSTSLF